MIYTAYTVNCDCANLSCEEFINLMINGYNEAVKNHRNRGEKIKYEYVNKRETEYIESHTANLHKMLDEWSSYACKKWVTEKRRQKYITEQVEKYLTYPYKNTYSWDDKFDSPQFFDIKVQPGEMCINNCYIINNKALNVDYLTKTYNMLIHNKYFINAKGWTYDIDCGDNSWGCYCRPAINMIVSAELKQEMYNAEHNLTTAVEDFYKNTNYFGD